MGSGASASKQSDEIRYNADVGQDTKQNVDGETETESTGKDKPNKQEDGSPNLSALKQNTKTSLNEKNYTNEKLTKGTDEKEGEGSDVSNKAGEANNKNERFKKCAKTPEDAEDSTAVLNKEPKENSDTSSDRSLPGRNTFRTSETKNTDSTLQTRNTQGAFASAGQKNVRGVFQYKHGSQQNAQRDNEGVAETQTNKNADNKKSINSNIPENPRVEITEHKEQNNKKVREETHARNDHRGRQENDQKAINKHKLMINELKSKAKEFLERYGNREVFANVMWKGLDKFSAASGQTVRSTDPRTDYSTLEKKLIDLKREKVKHLNRLSEIASSRLQHNNPDIADLSDENRATKLAEKLSELYDNEWTDVYEAVKKKARADTTDETIALSLKEILKVCYDTCREKSQTQRSFVLRALYMNRGQDETNVPAGLGLSLTVLQKSAADASLEQLEKIFPSKIQGWLPGNFVLKKLSPTKRPLSSYINLCTRLSWHIQTQNPPLVLDFEGKENPTVLFRPYTVSGQHLSYVLWPALFLHENGPVVSKGVAQFSKEPENETGLQSDNKEGQNVPKPCPSEW